MSQCSSCGGLKGDGHVCPVITSKYYRFFVRSDGELSAGIEPFTDVVTVRVESGNPGGETGDFEKYMSDALAEWFNAKVRQI